jgi:uncharacterized protein YndB with AHSA1/START domain
MRPEVHSRREPGAPGARSVAAPARRAPIRLVQRFSASAQRVFEAWLDPVLASRWLFATATHPMTHVAIDARVGGSFCFADRGNGGGRIEHRGTYLEIVPPKLLAFTLTSEDRPLLVTRVTVEIAPLKRGCELQLTHDNVPPEDAVHTEERWTGILYGLDVTLDELSQRRPG